MTLLKTETRKWGNSIAIIIPNDVVQKENIKDNQKITLFFIKESKDSLSKMFGLGKNKLTKTGQQIKDELRKELHG